MQFGLSHLSGTLIAILVFFISISVFTSQTDAGITPLENEFSDINDSLNAAAGLTTIDKNSEEENAEDKEEKQTTELELFVNARKGCMINEDEYTWLIEPSTVNERIITTVYQQEISGRDITIKEKIETNPQWCKIYVTPIFSELDRVEGNFKFYKIKETPEIRITENTRTFSRSTTIDATLNGAFETRLQETVVDTSTLVWYDDKFCFIAYRMKAGDIEYDYTAPFTGDENIDESERYYVGDENSYYFATSEEIITLAREELCQGE